MKVRKLCILALFAAIALSIWAAEALIPPLVPLPGIRLGLANIVILLTLYLFGRREAALVLAVRLILGAALAGTVMSFLYSLAGGLLALGVMALLRPRVDETRIWMLSAYAAVAHGLGQLGSPGLAAFHRAKSRGSRFSSLTSTRSPARSWSTSRPDSTPYERSLRTEKYTSPLLAT